MSRPRTLADLNNDDVPARINRHRNDGDGGGGGERWSTGGLFGGMDGEQPKHPRKENFCNMWTYTFCPGFSLCSFTFVMSMVMLVIFIAELITTSIGEEGALNDKFFLGVRLDTLKTFGMRIPWLIKQNYEVQRLLLPVVLHFGFSHLVINFFLFWIVGFMIEKAMGAVRYALFFFIVALGSQIFACVCSSYYAIGAEPVIFGSLAAIFAMFVVYWNRIGNTCGQKTCIIIMMSFFVVIGVLMLVSVSRQYSTYTTLYALDYPDTYGCVGGFIFGFFSALAILPPGDPRVSRSTTKYEQCVRIIGIVTAGVLFVILCAVFGASSDPTVFWS